MRTVVDASVTLQWYFEEPGSPQAEALLDEHAAGRRDLIAPDLLIAEFGNGLWKKVRRGECDRDAADAILELWEVDRPELVPCTPLIERALDLALALDHAVYDCLYVAAAVAHEATLATADRQLARAARTVLARIELVG